MLEFEGKSNDEGKLLQNQSTAADSNATAPLGRANAGFVSSGATTGSQQYNSSQSAEKRAQSNNTIKSATTPPPPMKNVVEYEVLPKIWQVYGELILTCISGRFEATWTRRECLGVRE